MENFDKKPDFQVNQASDSSPGTIAVIIIALVLVVGAVVYFSSSWNGSANGPQVTQNTTLPAPITEEPATPAPGSPPAVEPATPPATPPAPAPATNP
jgi:flagellar basal body-associated protein FliL